MNVSDLMTTPVRACRTDDFCSVPAQMMWEGDCGCVPVIDLDGKLAGIVTDRDLCMAAHTSGRPLGTIPVVRVMAHEVRALRADAPVEEALSAMGDTQVHRLPVVDPDGRLTGVIAISDILIHEARRLGARAAPVVKTMARIHLPRGQESIVEIKPARRASRSGGAKKATAKKTTARKATRGKR